jgi:hypothetical protein
MLKATTLFVGSISPGISDGFLTSLFAVRVVVTYWGIMLMTIHLDLGMWALA